MSSAPVLVLKAVILAGGYGKRLRPLTDERPKPLLEVGGVPILAWQLHWLRRHGIGEVVLCTGYMKDSIINYVGSGGRFGVKVGYVVEEEPLGTGGALKNAELLLRSENRFIMLNGDILTNLDPKMLQDQIHGETIAAMAVVPLTSPYGVVEVSEGSSIIGFREKPLLTEYWINAGAYCFSSDIFRYLPDKGNIETTTFPRLAETGSIKAVKYTNVFWRSIDTHKDIEEAAYELRDELRMVSEDLRTVRDGSTTDSSP